MEKQTEKTIQKLLGSRFSGGNIKYTVPNLYLFKYDWETDFLVVQKNSHYCYEIEIKVSRSDFLNDFKKKQKHSILKSGVYEQERYKYVMNPATNKKEKEYYSETKKWDFRPNKFYYCVPEGLVKVEEVPEYAGLMYSNGQTITTVKEAKFIHKEKLKLEEKLCEKFYYYWKDEERSVLIQEKIIKDLSDKLNENKKL